MAYGNRRTSYRRKGRRSARTLSTRRIFSNKSARSQAKQINALKRRVNRVYSRTKPEVKVSEDYGYTSLQLLPYQYTSHPFAFTLPVEGTADNNRIGSAVNVVSHTLFLSAKYSISTRSAQVPVYNQTLGASGAAMRIIAVQSKVPRNDVPVIGSLMHSPINTSNVGIESMANMKIPFEVGITTSFHVLYDKVFYFNSLKPVFAKRINIRPVRRKVLWNPQNGVDTTYTYPAGQVFVYIIQGGLESTNIDLTAEGTDYSSISLSYTQKTAFTDP